MECICNGKTEEVTRRCQERFSGSWGKGLGDVSSPGAINGVESLRTSSENCERRDIFGSNVPRESSAGKILKRLKFIQEEYLSYVRGHQQRLEARLHESKEREAIFLEAIHELEQEVYALTSSKEELEKPE